MERMEVVCVQCTADEREREREREREALLFFFREGVKKKCVPGTIYNMSYTAVVIIVFI